MGELYICVSDDDQCIEWYVPRNLPSGNDTEQVVISPDEQRIYVANEDDAPLSVFDIPSRPLMKEIAGGVEPEGVAVSP
jgi:YVTN family beta-propeller protein